MEYSLENMTGKSIIFYSTEYNRAEQWFVFDGDEEETKEAIRAWEALGVVPVGLFMGYLDGEPQLEPFEGHTVDDLKQFLTVCDGCVIPPGMKGVWDDMTIYTMTKVNTEDWGI